MLLGLPLLALGVVSEILLWHSSTKLDVLSPMAPALSLVSEVMQALEGESQVLTFMQHTNRIIACRYGFTSRQWGFTLDTMVGATVVLANGTIVNASATTHSDLFWVC